MTASQSKRRLRDAVIVFVFREQSSARFLALYFEASGKVPVKFLPARVLSPRPQPKSIVVVCRIYQLRKNTQPILIEFEIK